MDPTPAGSAESRSARTRRTAASDLRRSRRFSSPGAGCATVYHDVLQETVMPDDQPLTSHVSLRVPNDVIEALDRIAAALERPRSWVMLRALRQYLEEGEGREIEEDTESLAELDRGEVVSAEELHERLRQIIARSEQAGAHDQ